MEQDRLVGVMVRWPPAILAAVLRLTVDHVQWMSAPNDCLTQSLITTYDEDLAGLLHIPAETTLTWIDLLDRLARSADVGSRCWTLWTRVGLIAALQLSGAARLWLCLNSGALRAACGGLGPVRRERLGPFLRPFLAERMDVFFTRGYTDAATFLAECTAYYLFGMPPDMLPFVRVQLEQLQWGSGTTQ